MTTITPGVTIGSATPVTRQTLYDLWANGTLGQVAAADLAAGVLPILSGTGTTIGQQPGAVLFDGYEQLWKVFVDVIDDTGASIWLAFGPDRFDEACIAAEPLAPGAAVRVDPTMGGRWVRRTSGWGDGSIVGFNQAPSTTASGAWFPCGVEGMVWAWWAYKPANSTETGTQGGVPTQTAVAINWALGALGVNPGGNMNVGTFVLGWPLATIVTPTTISEGNQRQLLLFTGPRWGL